jgi:ABC-type nitrate/sulfonate/bicarbonate transport system permease component
VQHGFVVGVAGGVVVGVLLGQVRFLADVASPYIKVANAIPRIVLGSLFTVALGLGIASKVLLASVLVFFVVFFNAFQASARWTGTCWPTPGCWVPHGSRSPATWWCLPR